MHIAAVVVLYFPDTEKITKLIRELEEQVTQILFIDNTPGISSRHFDPALSDKISYTALHDNSGIAKAQNTGIGKALESGAEYVLFLDQDSLPAAGSVAALSEAYTLIEDKGFKIGGVGPRIADMATGQKELPAVNKGIRISPSITKVGQLMSSGTLVKSEVFLDAGTMEEALFIDSVEFEWCWRAANKGYAFFLTDDALLWHNRGEHIRKILSVPIHITTPFRKYYQYRNFLILVTRPYVPFYWKMANLFKYSFKFFYYSFFISPRRQYCKRMIQGLNAGLYYWITGKIK